MNMIQSISKIVLASILIVKLSLFGYGQFLDI